MCTKRINVKLWFETFLETHIFECTRNVVVPHTIKNPKSQWRHSGVFIVNFEHVIAGWERTYQFYFYVACYLYVTESF